MKTELCYERVCVKAESSWFSSCLAHSVYIVDGMSENSFDVYTLKVSHVGGHESLVC
jgi:hypothetical protein